MSNWRRSNSFASLNAPAAVHAGQAAAELTVANQASILRSLRAANKPESHAVAKLIKRGKLELKFMPTDPSKRGAAVAKPYGSNVIEIYTDVSTSARRAAGVTAHEAKHWLQKLTKSSYRRVHEFEAFQYQRSTGYLKLTEDQIWEIINTHPAYKDDPR